ELPVQNPTNYELEAEWCHFAPSGIQLRGCGRSSNQVGDCTLRHSSMSTAKPLYGAICTGARERLRCRTALHHHPPEHALPAWALPALGMTNKEHARGG